MQEKMAFRFGVGAMALALTVQLLGSSALAPLLEKLFTPEAACVLLFLETGRLARPVTDTFQGGTTTVTPTVSKEPVAFSQEDTDLVEANAYCSYTPDLTAALQADLTWDLTEGGPKVLILHTHGSESYEKTENYTETTRYRTLNTQYNMISLGDRLAQLLEDGGVEVVHDRAVHDYPSYTSAYSQSRIAIQKYLDQYPDICLVLDLHRDALQDKKGNQIGYTVDTPLGEAARVMLVVGTDDAGLNHPDWQKNLSLAVKLHAQLEKNTPGLCRPISFRSQRFNQDLSTGALLLEVGAAGNTRQEALLAVELIAQGILQLAHGAQSAVW